MFFRSITNAAEQVNYKSLYYLDNFVKKFVSKLLCSTNKMNLLIYLVLIKFKLGPKPVGKSRLRIPLCLAQ